MKKYPKELSRESHLGFLGYVTRVTYHKMSKIFGEKDNDQDFWADVNFLGLSDYIYVEKHC